MGPDETAPRGADELTKSASGPFSYEQGTPVKQHTSSSVEEVWCARSRGRNNVMRRVVHTTPVVVTPVTRCYHDGGSVHDG